MPAARKRSSTPPKTAKNERWYARQLRKVSRHIGDIIGAFPPGDSASEPVIRRALNDYSDLITSWASATAARMLQGVRKEDDQAWRSRSIEMSVALRDEILNAPTGALMRARLDEQVALIKSLPLDAANRVHEWTLLGLEDAGRAKEVAEAIKNSEDVSANRATLIARTEVARTASLLTEARAKHVGSEGYIWRTSNDSDVRESHREMNGKYVPWAAPPTLSDGTTTHAGQIYNCRCYPEPIIPD